MRSALHKQPHPIATHLASARKDAGVSQEELALRARLKRQQINYFETGARVPSIQQLLLIATALHVPLQRLLNGTNRLGHDTRELGIELYSLGLIDLWVEDTVVPGAFRRPEEILAIAATGRRTEPRIIEALPALLAWNRVDDRLLWAFARTGGRATVYRLAWLADVTLTLERTSGFPGGCPAKDDLIAFLKRVKPPPVDRWDDLGHPAHEPPKSPVWKRWRIRYGGDLTTFRQRAESLISLAQSQGRRHPVGRG